MKVRPLRGELVKAAERVMRQLFEGPRGDNKLSKTQLAQLAGVCGEAACHEEIANYLRYQAGRPQPAWSMLLVKAVVEGLEKSTAGQESEVRLEAWRRYATYLSRAFTYEKARERAAGGARR